MAIAPSKKKFLQSRTNQAQPTKEKLVGCELIGKKEKEIMNKDKEWLGVLLTSNFFGQCPNHPDEEKKREEKVFCIECVAVLCRQCSQSHCLHNKLKIRKYMYNYVIRLQDVQKYFDCYRIQTYKINGEKAVHLNPRPQSEDAKPSTKAKFGGSCEACRRYIQDLPNRFCSIECKVSVDSMKHKTLDKNTNVPCRVHELSLKANSNPEERNCSENEELSSFSDVSEDSPSSRRRGRPFLKPRTRLRKRKLPRRAPLF